MLPGDPIIINVRRRTAAGLPATGMLIADFSLKATLNGVVVALTPTLTELDTVGTWRIYTMGFNIPATPGNFTFYVEPATGTDQVAEGVFGGVTESIDLRSIYSVIAVPIISVVNAGGPQGDIALRLVKFDYTPLSFSVHDTAGNPIDLSAWSGWQFGVRDQLQDEGTPFLQTTGITATTAGLVTILIAKTSAFYNFLTTGKDQVQLYWSLNGNEAADATKRRTVGRGTLAVVRQETL